MLSALKGVATLIKPTFKPSFKPLKVVVSMTQKRCRFEAWFKGASNHLQTYLQITLQTGDAYVNSVKSWFEASLKVV